MTAPTAKDPKEITGRHVFAMTASAFALIIGVNFWMAYQAVSTFPGLEVKNSYVASQSFDARRKAQQALNWTADARIAGDLLTLSITGPDGAPATPASLTALLGRTTSAADDQTPDFAATPDGYTANVDVAKGLWTLRIKAKAQDGTAFEQRLTLRVP